MRNHVRVNNVSELEGQFLNKWVRNRECKGRRHEKTEAWHWQQCTELSWWPLMKYSSCRGGAHTVRLSRALTDGGDDTHSRRQQRFKPTQTVTGMPSPAECWMAEHCQDSLKTLGAFSFPVLQWTSENTRHPSRCLWGPHFQPWYSPRCQVCGSVVLYLPKIIYSKQKVVFFSTVDERVLKYLLRISCCRLKTWDQCAKK